MEHSLGSGCTEGEDDSATVMAFANLAARVAAAIICDSIKGAVHGSQAANGVDSVIGFVAEAVQDLFCARRSHFKYRTASGVAAGAVTEDATATVGRAVEDVLNGERRVDRGFAVGRVAAEAVDDVGLASGSYAENLSLVSIRTTEEG